MAMRDLGTRAVSSLGVGVVVIGLILSGSLSASLLVVLIVWLAASELWNMYFPDSKPGIKYFYGALVAAPMVIQLVAEQIDNSPMDAILGFLLLPLPLTITAFIQVVRPGEMSRQKLTAIAAATVLFAISGLCALFIIAVSHWYLLGVILLIWANDVFAYLTGSMLGRNKLAPSISPGKTWEGFVGGAVFTIALGWFLPQLYVEFAGLTWVIPATFVALFGTLGDLTQSVFKRSFGVKDSGKLIPGHGGMWDRFDSFCGSVPWIAFYLLLTHS